MCFDAPQEGEGGGQGELSHFRSNKATLLLFFARIVEVSLNAGRLVGTSISHERRHPLNSFLAKKKSLYLSRATLAGAMGLFCLRVSSCEIGPQNNCITTHENLDAAMSNTGSGFHQ